MKIKGITLGHLHNAEYIQFVRQILDKPSADLISSINAQAPKTALQEQWDALNNQHKKSTASALTELIESLDTQRDDAIIGISKVAEGFATHPDATIRQASKLITTSLKPYNFGFTISRLNYNAQWVVIIFLASKYFFKGFSWSVSKIDFATINVS